MIKFNCPKCGKEFKSKDEYAGRKFTCTECGKECSIPAPKTLRQPSAIAAADSVPPEVPPTPPLLKKPAKASAKPTEEPAEELSAPTEEPTKDHSGVKPKTLVGMVGPMTLRKAGSVIALLPLLPLLAGYKEDVVARWSVLCLFSAIVIWFFAILGWFKSAFRRTFTSASETFTSASEGHKNALAMLEAENGKLLAAQMLELRGLQGKTVSVDGATIRMVKAAWGLASQREKSLPIRNISSVEVKMPGAVMSGFIQFSIAGGAARNSSLTLSGGSFDAAQDENSVVFVGQSAYQIALKIKEYIETYQERASSSGSPVSAADEIVKLKALMDQGIITPEEFAIKKRRFIES